MQIELDRIYNMDCIEGMRYIPDAYVDLIVTDPPYLMSYKTNRRQDKTHDFCTTIANDDNPDLIKRYIAECYRIMKPDTAMYMFCNQNKVDFFLTELKKYFSIKNMIIWVKNSHTAGDLEAQFGKQYEIILLVNKGRARIKGKRLTDVWYAKRVTGAKQVHQNQKPLELVQLCIEKHSEPGDIVFDGFIGSGTTAVAAKMLCRHYIGFEIEPKYYKIAVERLQNVQRRLIV